MKSAISECALSSESLLASEVKGEVESFLLAVESYPDDFSRFCCTFIKTMKDNIVKCVCEPCRSKEVQREKIWKSFHQLQRTCFTDMWAKLFDTVGTSMKRTVTHHVSRYLYEKEIIAVTAMHSQLSMSTVQESDTELSPDEETVLRHAVGYVPFKLLKRYEKQSSPRAISYAECLSQMAVNGDESDLVSYSREWTRLCNRGGLFEVNDMCLMMFKEIELAMRGHLLANLKGSTSNDRDTIIKSVAANENVRFYWSMISVDIQDEEHAITLLEEVIALWLTIRGYSIARHWIEHHKEISKCTKQRH